MIKALKLECLAEFSLLELMGGSDLANGTYKNKKDFF